MLLTRLKGLCLKRYTLWQTWTWLLFLVDKRLLQFCRVGPTCATGAHSSHLVGERESEGQNLHVLCYLWVLWCSANNQGMWKRLTDAIRFMDCNPGLQLVCVLLPKTLVSKCLGSWLEKREGGRALQWANSLRVVRNSSWWGEKLDQITQI